MKSITTNMENCLYGGLATAAEMQGLSLDACRRDALEQYVKTFNDVMNCTVGEEYENIILESIGLPISPRVPAQLPPVCRWLKFID
jgi:hypothetical protein